MTQSAQAAPRTKAEKLVLAAFQLEEEGHTPFDAEEIIVTAWQVDPDTFGLRHYVHEHPDSNKVLSYIMGKRGLESRGMLLKVGKKRYKLTRRGRREARRLMGQTADENAPDVDLERRQLDFLSRLYETTAVRKLLDNAKDSVSFTEMCKFWQIPEDYLTDENVDELLAEVEDSLDDIESALGTGRADLRGKRTVTADDVNDLLIFHEEMKNKFKQHFNLIRHRTTRPT